MKKALIIFLMLLLCTPPASAVLMYSRLDPRMDPEDSPTFVDLILSGGNIMSATSIKLKPSDDNDDYFDYSTVGNIPTLTIEGNTWYEMYSTGNSSIWCWYKGSEGDFLVGWDNAEGYGELHSSGHLRFGTLGVNKDIVLQATGNIDLFTSGDPDDYIRVTTVANVPTVTAFGGSLIDFPGMTLSADTFTDGVATLSGGNIFSPTSIKLIPSGDLDDYLVFSTSLNAPFTSIIGGNIWIVTSDSNEVNMSVFEDFTHNGVWGWDKTLDKFFVLSTHGLELATGNNSDITLSPHGTGEVIINSDLDITPAGGKWKLTNNSQTMSMSASPSMSSSDDYTWPATDAASDRQPIVSNASAVLRFGDVYYSQDEVNDIVEGNTFDFFLNDTLSGIGSPEYRTMDATQTGEAESTFSDTITNDAFLIDSFTTTVNEPTFTNLIKGVFTLHIHGETTVGANVGTARIFWELYRRLADSPFTETLLITSEESNILTSVTIEYNIHGTLAADFMLNTTDGLVLKVYANIETSRPQDPVVTLRAEGTTASRFEVVTNITAFDDRYVLVTGDTMSGPLVSTTITASTELISGDINIEIDPTPPVDAGANIYWRFKGDLTCEFGGVDITRVNAAPSPAFLDGPPQMAIFDDSVYYRHDDYDPGTSAFSISFVMRRTRAQNGAFIGVGDGISTKFLFVRLQTNGTVRLQTGGAAARTSALVHDNDVLYHMVLTVPGGSPRNVDDIELYTDGVAQPVWAGGGGTYELTGTGQDIYIGAQSNTGGVPWEGHISDVAVYSKELSPAEALALFNGQKRLTSFGGEVNIAGGIGLFGQDAILVQPSALTPEESAEPDSGDADTDLIIEALVVRQAEIETILESVGLLP